MNLINTPLLSELQNLVNQVKADYFQLRVSYKGQVTLVSNEGILSSKLNNSKFYIPWIPAHKYKGSGIIQLRHLNQLYKNLVYCWEKNMLGYIDYDHICESQNLYYWFQMHNIVQPQDLIIYTSLPAT